MDPNKLIIPFEAYDLDHIIADQETIRRYNRQRHEMEQLTAIVYEDPEKHIIVGYKDLTNDEFWVRGHMPGMPILPGVILCEIAAQVCSYYSMHRDLTGPGSTLGFGGINDVRFRDLVTPGQRLVMACQVTRIRVGKMFTSRFQAFVERKIVAEGEMIGIVLPTDEAIRTRSDA